MDNSDNISGGQGESAAEPNAASAHRSGFVAVAGRPNVGKSTLVNRIVGQELCIVTPKAQTTRHRITAIHTMPHAQIALQDTPGIHEAVTPLNRSMVATAVKTIEEADAVLLIVTPEETEQAEDHRIVGLIQKAGTRCVLAINKIDTVEPRQLLPVMDRYSKLHGFEAIVPVSALLGRGVDDLLDELIRLLPEGPRLFPEDDVSDLPLRFFVAELVREQITRKTGQEIPYKTAVVVESFKEQANRVLIHADIHVEKDSQKKIIVGRQGRMIKQIGTAARHRIEEFLGRNVRLELFVKVTPHWTQNQKRIDELLDPTSGA